MEVQQILGARLPGWLNFCVVINIFLRSYMEHWTVMKPFPLVLYKASPKSLSTFFQPSAVPYLLFLPGCFWSTPFLVPWGFLFSAFLSVAPSGLHSVWPIHCHFFSHYVVFSRCLFCLLPKFLLKSYLVIWHLKYMTGIGLQTIGVNYLSV